MSSHHPNIELPLSYSMEKSFGVALIILKLKHSKTYILSCGIIASTPEEKVAI
jgi:hypothetical protein